jgi:hypothetical protein
MTATTRITTTQITTKAPIKSTTTSGN